MKRRLLGKVIFIVGLVAAEDIQAATYTVTNTGNGGSGSLRAAINDANGSSGPHTIVFNIPGTAPHTITLSAALPVINREGIIIDASTQPANGYAGTVPRIILDGNHAVSKGIEVSPTRDGFQLYGMQIQRFTDYGLYIPGHSGHIIGATGKGNVFIQNGNGTTGDAAIYIKGGTIRSNIIGMDAGGTAASGNNGYGISLPGSGTAIIGGNAEGEGNVISANANHGIYMINSDNSGITGNKIGTDINGSGNFGNGGSGIYMINGSSFVTIEGNVVSNNGANGIYNDGGNGLIVKGNKIGAGQAGTSNLGNMSHGIYLTGSANDAVIGDNTGGGNVISGNSGNGIFVTNGPDNSVIRGNKIGTGITGTENMGNGLHGILISGALTGGHTIGGVQAGDGNIIAYNGVSGVAIDAAGGITTDNNVISRNSIYCNTTEGISLLNNGNDGIAAPVITSANATTVSGTSVANATIEVYKDNDNCLGCQGKTFIGTTTANGSGNWTLNGNFIGSITAHATLNGKGTSPFAACVLSVADLVADAGGDTIVCIGNNIVIGGNPTASGGIPPYLYTWNPSSSLNFSNISNPGASPLNSMTYTVTVTDAYGNTASDVVSVTAEPIPSATLMTDSLSMQSGPYAGLTVLKAEPGGYNNYYFYRNGDSIQSGQDNILPLLEFAVGDTFIVFVTNNGCVSPSNIIIISPMPTGPIGSLPAPGPNCNLVPNSDFETSTSCPSFGSSPAMCHFLPVGTTTFGGYTWTGIDIAPPWFQPALGTSDYFHVCSSVSGVPVNWRGNQFAHSGNAYIGLWAQVGMIHPSNEANLKPGDGTREYIQSPLICPLEVGQKYRVSMFASLSEHSINATNNLGIYLSQAQITRTDNKPFLVIPQVFSASVITTVPPNQWVEIFGTVIGNNESYLTIGIFHDDLGTQRTLNPNVAVSDPTGRNYTGAYYYIDDVAVIPLPPDITVNGPTTVCPGQSITITASGGASYLWSNGATTPSITVSPTSTTTYTVKSILNCNCDGPETSITITVQDIIADAGIDKVICPSTCEDIQASVAGGSGLISYIWSNGLLGPGPHTICPNTSETYTVTVTDANGCTATDEVSVDIDLVIADAGPDKTLCKVAPQSGIVIGPALGLSGQTYLWSPAADLNDPATFAPFASPNATTTYTVTVTNVNGCTATDQMVLSVFPSVVFTGGSLPDNFCPNNICDGSASVIVTAGTPPFTYQWDDPTMQTTPTATGLCVGNHNIQITDINGCNANGGLFVDGPVYTLTQNNICSPGSGGVIIEMNPSYGITPYTYSWSTGSNTNSSGFISSGTQYTVTITDNTGCQVIESGIAPNCKKGGQVFFEESNVREPEYLELFPNPTAGRIFIKTNASIESSVIMDVLGNVVQAIVVSEFMDIDSLPKGVYILRSITSSGKMFMKKIILQ